MNSSNLKGQEGWLAPAALGQFSSLQQKSGGKPPFLTLRLPKLISEIHADEFLRDRLSNFHKNLVQLRSHVEPKLLPNTP